MTTVARRAAHDLHEPVAGRPAKPEASGRERFWWYFMRLSGLALVILALGHMFIMHVLVELTGGEIDFAFVQSRWGTPFWRIYDLAAPGPGLRPRRERRARRHRRLRREPHGAQPHHRHLPGHQPRSGWCSAWRSSPSSIRTRHRRRGRSRDPRHRAAARSRRRASTNWTPSWSGPAAPACTRRSS